MYTRSTPRGVTLMEIIVASTVFAMVISISFVVTIRATKSFQEQVREGTLAHKSETVLKSMEEELGDATLIASGTNAIYDVVANGYTYPSAEIRYKVPLRYKNPTTNPKGYTVFVSAVPAGNNPTFPADGTGGGDFDFRLRYGWRDRDRYVGNADDSNNMVPLQGPGLKLGTVGPNSVPSGVTSSSGPFTCDGVSYPGGTLKGGYMCFRFQPNTALKMGKYGSGGVISEYMENVDIDGDGYKTGYYAIGYLERCYFVGDPNYEQLVPDSRVPVGEGVILQPMVISSGPVDQLRSNRIFTRDSSNPARLNIFLWMLSMDAEGLPHLMQSKVAIFMRNNATYVTSASATGTN